MKVLRDEVKDSNWLNRGEKILGEIVEGRGEIRSYKASRARRWRPPAIASRRRWRGWSYSLGQER